MSKAASEDRPAGTAYVDAAEPATTTTASDDDWGLPEDDEDYFDDDEEDLRREDSLNAVNDQDWDTVGGDFTKRYNRMKQAVMAVHSSTASSAAASSSNGGTATKASEGVIPASNRARPSTSASTSTSTSLAHSNKVSDQLASFSHSFSDRLELGPLFPTSSVVSRKGGSARVVQQLKDKSDRATNEQVLDDRTRLILFKMIGRGLLERIDGCVSTGKEANVYHAISPEGRHLALKIYKTSILIFKDRDRYVSGEFRFKSGYARSNPRKMVRLWAEKEMRNLRRMKGQGMKVPEVLEVRENVLVMDFLGGGGDWEASPRLKDADLTGMDLEKLYLELLVILRTIYKRCKLVHADLSEYNILLHEGHPWVIDVSQSVEHSHPSAFDFLRSDIGNIDAFFARRGIVTLGLSRTFAYVVAETLGELKGEWERGVNAMAPKEEEETDQTVEEVALLLLEKRRAGLLADLEEEEETLAGEAEEGEGGAKERREREEEEDKVFKSAYIPRALNDVYNPERDVEKVRKGEGGALIYAGLLGKDAVVASSSSNSVEANGAAVTSEGAATTSDDDSDEDGDSDSDEEDGSEDEYGNARPRGKKHEPRDEKKERRKAVKEAAREKRKDKMKKGEKARRVKKSSGKK